MMSVSTPFSSIILSLFFSIVVSKNIFFLFSVISPKIFLIIKTNKQNAKKKLKRSSVVVSQCYVVDVVVVVVDFHFFINGRGLNSCSGCVRC